MIHITITGPNAGQILCGIRRHDLNEGDRTCHWPYLMTPEQEQAFRAQCCPECLKVWDDPDEESEDA